MSRHALEPLGWDVPGAWGGVDVPRGGTKKAAYKVPRAGDDKEDAELTVHSFGTGSLGDVPANFKEWFDQFDGDLGPTAKRESFEVRGIPIETVEIAGTYKVALTPSPSKGRAAPVQMVKQNFRLRGAAVKTPDRGTWFFKLTGPDDTVQAASSGFRAVLDSVR